jgi:UDP-3-O-[3-hydroxymyristoyl] glucosamine N-acyltransferase
MATSLGELASQFGCELRGDPAIEISRVAALHNAAPGALSFLSGAAFKPQLAATRAAAVILRAADADDCPTACLIHDNPYACYARIAGHLHPPAAIQAGIHEQAAVSDSAKVSASAQVDANATISDTAELGDRCYIGPGSVVGPGCKVGADTRLLANVTLVRNVEMGKRCIIHPGAVLGSDGFGNAMTPEGWVKVPQIGGLKVGDDVEIGANTAIDLGAIGDTVIENGVRIDNLVHIAHNCRIGEHTAIAGQCGFAGSTTVGKRCMFAGQVGIVGHITICDDVIFSGKAVVSKNITRPGVYASVFPSEPVQEWNRKVARFRRIDKLIERVSELEKKQS